MSIEVLREDAAAIYRDALKAVHGQRCVSMALQQMQLDAPVYVLALGKAAAAMAAGAAQALDGRITAGLAVTRYGYGQDVPGEFRLLEAAHPIPDQNSLAAGQAVLEFCQAVPPAACCLLLISGGASALAELPWPSIFLEQLQDMNRYLLASGLPIQAMNECRSYLSQIKGGGLLRVLRNRRSVALLISDVAGDNPAVIGSGLAVPTEPLQRAKARATVARMFAQGQLPARFTPLFLAAERAGAGLTRTAPTTVVEVQLVASLTLAKQAAAEAATRLGYRVEVDPAFIGAAASECGSTLARRLIQVEGGLYIWGGEPSVVLPPNPGLGGRAQQLALSAAITLAGHTSMVLLAAGTDGADGNSAVAGALVDGETVSRAQQVLGPNADALDYLQRADSGHFLAASGDLLVTGPTGTNVMDLMIGIKCSAHR